MTAACRARDGAPAFYPRATIGMPPWGGTPFQAPGSAFRGRRDEEGDKRKGKRMRDMPLLAVEEVPTDSLVPYANNAKIHTNEQIDQICASIGEFGFNDPVAVWDSPRGETEIIEGHGRVMAAKKLGLGTLPIIRLDHLTDAQRRAYTHVHNQLTMNTGWDFDKLEIDLEGLDFDFGDFGFDLPASPSESDSPYSAAVKGLMYEPSDDTPSIDELMDDSERLGLASEVEAADGITEGERAFLLAACGRFTRFDYERIADYYAGAGAECRGLMRRLKLVIVDDGSIEDAAEAFLDETKGVWDVA